jgi:UDP-2,3-diacylglucosamine pyrophosphatase LpxH
MDQKPVTLIVSDLHIGDRKPGDDFVNDKNQFAKFVCQQLATPEGRAGEIELIINGDFLEFVQVCPEAYRSEMLDFWCSEEESVAKLECILQGHPEVFDALAEFQRPGNLVTLHAGNHDIDIYWDKVQNNIRRKAGPVSFELGSCWYKRYGGRLHISHGHLFPSIDPANVFQNWRDPRLRQASDALPPRLEMCPGTLFMVRFVNRLEQLCYKFADNLHPPIALAGVLWREDKWGFKAVAWLLSRFARNHPMTILSNETETDVDIGPRLVRAILVDGFLREKIAGIYREVLQQPAVTAADVAARLVSEDAVAEFIEQLMRCEGPWERWVDVFDLARPSTLSTDDATGKTLAIGKAGFIKVEAECEKIARATWLAGAQIVVLGHTHLPQKVEGKDGNRYYNPGSWTRYVKADRQRQLRLADLRQEDRFPYELNCIRIEDTSSAWLRTDFLCIDRN